MEAQVTLDVYFRAGIADVLRSTAFASEGAAGVALEVMSKDAEDQERLLQAYRLGVRNALISVGLAFRLEPVGPNLQPRPGVSPALAGLLWSEIPERR